MFTPSEFYLEEGNLVVSLFPFFGGLSAGFYLFFIDYFENERFNPIYTSIFGFFLGGFFVNIMFRIFFPDFFSSLASNQLEGILPILLKVLMTTNFPATYFVIYVTIVALVNLQKIKKQVEIVKQKRQIYMLQITILCYYLYTTVTVVIGYLFSSFLTPDQIVFFRHFAPHLGVITGSVVIYHTYIQAPVSFLQFQKIEKLLVINSKGLLLFSYDFRTKSESERDLLLSGGIYAIQNMFSEMVNPQNLTMIEFQDYQVALYYHEKFLALLVADKITSYLWSALTSFSNMFNLNFGSDINKELSLVPQSIFEGAKSLIDLSFGYH